MVRLEPVVLSLPRDDAEELVFLVRAVTADDVAYGEASLADADVFLPALDFFSDAVANTEPRDFNLTWQRLMALLDEYTPDPLEAYTAVLGAIDLALWDLAGRALEAPCYRLLGGLRARRVDCYAGGLRAEQGDLAQAADALLEQFGAVEMRLAGDAASDVPAIHRLRRAVGEQALFMVDGGDGYANPDDARKVGEAVAQVEGFWFENPLPTGRWTEYAHLRDTLGTGLAGGRSLTTLPEVETALQARAFDILSVDLRRCGGLSGARRLADMVHRHNVRMTLHNGPSPLAQVAAAHLAAAHWHVGPLQVEPAEGPVRELLSPAPRFEDGFLLVPDEPGLGSRVQEAIVKQYQVELPDEPLA